MSNINVEVVKELLIRRPKDLLDLMEGDSVYCKLAPKNLPKNREETYIRHMAREHIWFVSEFGVETQKAEKNGKFYSSYPEYFSQWLALDCLTLDEHALNDYLKDTPL